jgi:ABC-2 type transport system permease protein
MLAAQTGIELRLALRHPEQAIVTLFIPVVLLIGLTLTPVIALPQPRVVTVAPSILALAVLSTGFTSQAISFGFDRRYGVIARLAATALPRWLLIAGRLCAMFGVIVIQVALLGTIAALLGWRPTGAGILWAIPVLLLGGAACGSLGLLLGGALRAEVTLAVANVIWFVLLFVGGIAVPLSALPAGLAKAATYLPSGALAEGLHTTLAHGHPPGTGPVLVLVAWTLAAALTAVRTTKLR